MKRTSTNNTLRSCIFWLCGFPIYIPSKRVCPNMMKLQHRAFGFCPLTNWNFPNACMILGSLIWLWFWRFWFLPTYRKLAASVFVGPHPDLSSGFVIKNSLLGDRKWSCLDPKHEPTFRDFMSFRNQGCYTLAPMCPMLAYTISSFPFVACID